jgi:hypothetical protein
MHEGCIFRFVLFFVFFQETLVAVRKKGHQSTPAQTVGTLKKIEPTPSLLPENMTLSLSLSLFLSPSFVATVFSLPAFKEVRRRRPRSSVGEGGDRGKKRRREKAWWPSHIWLLC